MATRSEQIFINLPVKDLQATVAFFHRTWLRIQSAIHRRKCYPNAHRRQYFRHALERRFLPDFP